MIARTREEAEKIAMDNYVAQTRLETDFKVGIRKIFDDISAAVSRGIKSDGKVIDVDYFFNDDVSAFLKGQYLRTSAHVKKKFDEAKSRLLKLEVKANDDEDDDTEELLYYTALSKRQARIINDTTRDAAIAAVVAYRLTEVESGRVPSTDDAAAIASSAVVQSGGARENVIAQTEIGHVWSREVQNEAEAAQEDIGKPLEKEWVAVLDNNTRPAHAQADGQTVDINDPYLVGGDVAMYPRDIENMQPENYMNCRCESVARI